MRAAARSRKPRFAEVRVRSPARAKAVARKAELSASPVRITALMSALRYLEEEALRDRLDEVARHIAAAWTSARSLIVERRAGNRPGGWRN